MSVVSDGGRHKACRGGDNRKPGDTKLGDRKRSFGFLKIDRALEQQCSLGNECRSTGRTFN